MHIESVPNRKSHPTILLRESYRADGKVKKRTIANLTNWPEPLVEGLRTLLRGGVALATGADHQPFATAWSRRRCSRDGGAGRLAETVERTPRRISEPALS